MTVPEPAFYRLAPAMVARFMGLGLVLVAVLMFVMTAVVAGSSIPPDLLVVVLALGMLAVFGTISWLRRSYVVRLDGEGYSVRMVRGVGVAEGTWMEVTEAVAAHPHDVACVILHRADGTTTTIPMSMLAVDRDRFAEDVRGYLRRAHGSTTDPG
ncbi:MAG: hypothetical protein WB767_06100 [Nocardioides sp.]